MKTSKSHKYISNVCSQRMGNNLGSTNSSIVATKIWLASSKVRQNAWKVLKLELRYQIRQSNGRRRSRERNAWQQLLNQYGCGISWLHLIIIGAFVSTTLNQKFLFIAINLKLKRRKIFINSNIFYLNKLYGVIKLSLLASELLDL